MRDHRMPALRTIALVVLAVWGTAGHAAGLGPIRVQSALGQSLRASVPVLGADISELTASCIKVRLAQPDGAPMMAVNAAIARSGENPSILLSTRQSVNEPAVTLNLEVGCGASIQRSYQLLLDPVVSLPHLPQQEAATGMGNEISRNRLREQAMVAPAEEGVALAPARRIAARKARRDAQASAEPQVAVPQSAAPRQASRHSAQQEARKVTRSVLKLSSDDVAIDTGATFSPGLKLSDTLSESHDTGDAHDAAELKKAYDRFSAIMRDEDPAQNSEKQLQDMQAQLVELQKQTALLREQGEKQRAADLAAMASAKRDTVSSGWAMALGGLLLAALAAIGWLYRRVRELGREHSEALWEKTMLGPSTASAEWDNTMGADDTLGADEAFAATEISAGMPTPAKPSDWERGVPLDDTLAVDWASQQATMQAAAAQAPSLADAGAFNNDAFSIVEQIVPGSGSKAKPAAEPSAGKDRQPSPPQRQNLHSLPENKPAAASAYRTTRGAAGATNADAASMEVEEISDLMQEAEFWMLLNDPERAIDMLEPCLNVEKPVSPVPWIYLLDLYRATARRENYERLAVRIKKVFNTNAPAWDGQEAPARSLRDYPHVVEMIEDLWESDDIIPYLESLLTDEREGERAGFDLAVYREIIHLIGVARDPKTPRSREQLRFDDPQPRLISQKVSMPSSKAGNAAVPAISEEEAEIFDRAMSQQAVTRQVAAKSAAPRTAAPEPEPAKPAVPEPFLIQPPEPAAAGAEAEVEAGAEVAPLAVAQTAPPAIALEKIEPAIVSRKAEPAIAAAEFAEIGDPGVDAPAETPPSPTQEDDAERVADMARKLDLVLAYQEIGEHVGARVLLEEVIQGGTPLQVEKAKAMLKKLLREIDWQ